MSCCMLPCHNYTVRFEHCFWVLPDRRADKKNYNWWLCYVLACDKSTVTRRVCDELTHVTTSDHIVAQQANRYIVAFHIAISRYRTIRSGLLITGGL